MSKDDIGAFCLPDFSKCAPNAVNDLIPHLKEGLEHFTSMQWISTEESGSKDFQQSPVFNIAKNPMLTLAVCCVPCCYVATSSRALAKASDLSCETVCLSSVVLDCCCCCGLCWHLKV